MATWWLNWHDLTTLGNFMDNFWALLRTISSQFRDNWPTTLGHLWDKFKTTSKQLRDNFWTILRQFRDTFKTAWRQHYDNFEITKKNQIDNFEKTSGNFKTTRKQLCIHKCSLGSTYDHWSCLPHLMQHICIIFVDWRHWALLRTTSGQLLDNFETISGHIWDSLETTMTTLRQLRKIK